MPTSTPVRATLGAVSPMFVVSDAERAAAFYRDQLGFDVTYLGPMPDPYFAIVARDGAQLMLKAVGVAAVPNHTREHNARWDAYVHVADPDAFAAELGSRGVAFSAPLGDTRDGLRGFELADHDGYILFFGRPSS